MSTNKLVYANHRGRGVNVEGLGNLVFGMGPRLEIEPNPANSSPGRNEKNAINPNCEFGRKKCPFEMLLVLFVVSR